jgi:hypothetical protein
MLCQEKDSAVIDLTNVHWSELEPLIGELPNRVDVHGRLWWSRREALNRQHLSGLVKACRNRRRCSYRLRSTDRALFSGYDDAGSQHGQRCQQRQVLASLGVYHGRAKDIA